MDKSVCLEARMTNVGSTQYQPLQNKVEFSQPSYLELLFSLNSLIQYRKSKRTNQYLDQLNTAALLSYDLITQALNSPKKKKSCLFLLLNQNSMNLLYFSVILMKTYSVVWLKKVGKKKPNLCFLVDNTHQRVISGILREITSPNFII